MTISAVSVGTSAQSTVSTLTVAVSATGGAGRVVLAICTENHGTTPSTVSSVSGLSATWHSRSFVTANQLGQASEEWYADFAATTSGTVTINMSAGIDDAAVLAIFVSSNVGTIISDPNGSVPATGANNTGTNFTTPISTTSTAPYVLVMAGQIHGAIPTSPTPGFISGTAVSSVVNSGGIASQSAAAYGGQNAGALASTSVGLTGLFAASPWSVIVDAFSDQAASALGSMFAVMSP